MAFLTRLAGRHGATFKLADGKVIFAKKGSKSNPSGKAKPAVTLKEADVTSWSVTSSERGGHKSVICYWHDHAKNKRTKATAGSGKPVYRDKKVYRTQAEAQAAADGKLGELTRGKKAGQVEMPGQARRLRGGRRNARGLRQRRRRLLFREERHAYLLERRLYDVGFARDGQKRARRIATEPHSARTSGRAIPERRRASRRRHKQPHRT
jgi:phage protein D